jgi:hypothetical protein
MAANKLEGAKAEALYEAESEEAGDLAFPAGAIITNLSEVEGGEWLNGWVSIGSNASRLP